MSDTLDLDLIQQRLDALPSQDFYFDAEFEQTAFRAGERTLYVNLEGPEDDPVTQFFIMAPRAVRELLAEVRALRGAS